MAVELPEPLQWVLLLLAGTRWPEGEEDVMREMADRWRATGETLADVGTSVGSAIQRALDGQQGKAAEGLAAHWAKFSVGKGSEEDPGFFPGMVKSCEGMAEMLDNMANSTETAKIQIIAQLGILAFEIATAEASAPFTAGASLATIPAAVAVSRVVVQQILKKLLKEALEFAAKEAAQEVAINLLAQTIQIAEGNRTGLDGKELGQSALGGAVGGASGNLIGKGLGSAAGKAGLGNAMESVGGKMVHGAAVGVGADVSTQLITTGTVDGGSLLGSGLSGGSNVGLQHGASALKGKFGGDIPDVPTGGSLPSTDAPPVFGGRPGGSSGTGGSGGSSTSPGTHGADGTGGDSGADAYRGPGSGGSRSTDSGGDGSPSPSPVGGGRTLAAFGSDRSGGGDPTHPSTGGSGLGSANSAPAHTGSSGAATRGEGVGTPSTADRGPAADTGTRPDSAPRPEPVAHTQTPLRTEAAPHAETAPRPEPVARTEQPPAAPPEQPARQAEPARQADPTPRQPDAAPPTTDRAAAPQTEGVPTQRQSDTPPADSDNRSDAPPAHADNRSDTPPARTETEPPARQQTEPAATEPVRPQQDPAPTARPEANVQHQADPSDPARPQPTQHEAPAPRPDAEPRPAAARPDTDQNPAPQPRSEPEPTPRQQPAQADPQPRSEPEPTPRQQPAQADPQPRSEQAPQQQTQPRPEPVTAHTEQVSPEPAPGRPQPTGDRTDPHTPVSEGTRIAGGPVTMPRPASATPDRADAPFPPASDLTTNQTNQPGQPTGIPVPPTSAAPVSPPPPASAVGTPRPRPDGFGPVRRPSAPDTPGRTDGPASGGPRFAPRPAAAPVADNGPRGTKRGREDDTLPQGRPEGPKRQRTPAYENSAAPLRDRGYEPATPEQYQALTDHLTRHGSVPHPELTPELLDRVNPHAATMDGGDLYSCLEAVEALRDTHYGRPRPSGLPHASVPETDSAWTLTKRHGTPVPLGTGQHGVDSVIDQVRDSGPGSFSTVLFSDGPGSRGHVVALVHGEDGVLRWADPSTGEVREARPGALPGGWADGQHVWAATSDPDGDSVNSRLDQSVFDGDAPTFGVLSVVTDGSTLDPADRDVVRQLAQDIDAQVEQAAALALANPESVPDLDGYTRRWGETYKEWVDPQTTPERRAELQKWLPSQFGYVVESMTTQMIRDNVTLPPGYSIDTQVTHGSTRPDLVITKTGAEGGKSELGWLDITAHRSEGHIDDKQSSLWSSRPYVAETLYPSLDTARLGSGGTPEQRALVQALVQAQQAQAEQFKQRLDDFKGQVPEPAEGSKKKKQTEIEKSLGEALGRDRKLTPSEARNVLKGLAQQYGSDYAPARYGYKSTDSASYVEGQRILRGHFGADTPATAGPSDPPTTDPAESSGDRMRTTPSPEPEPSATQKSDDSMRDASPPPAATDRPSGSRDLAETPRSAPPQDDYRVTRPADLADLTRDLPQLPLRERAQAIASLPASDRRGLAQDPAFVAALRDTLPPGEFARTAAQLMVDVDRSTDRPASARAEATAQLTRMLQDPDTAARLLTEGSRLVVVPKDVPMTDLGPFAHLGGRTADSEAGGGRGWDDVRGSGGKWAAVTEENLLGERTTVGPDQHYPDGYSTTTHEFAHTVQKFGLSEADRALIGDTFRAKLDDESLPRLFGEDGPSAWSDGPRRRPDGSEAENYAARDEDEYFAQLSNAYLGTNHGTDPYTGQPRNNGADWVRANEPELLPLLERLYGPDPSAVHDGPANPVRATDAENNMYQGLRDFTAQVEGDVPPPETATDPDPDTEPDRSLPVSDDRDLPAPPPQAAPTRTEGEAPQHTWPATGRVLPDPADRAAELADRYGLADREALTEQVKAVRRGDLDAARELLGREHGPDLLKDLGREVPEHTLWRLGGEQPQQADRLRDVIAHRRGGVPPTGLEIDARREVARTLAAQPAITVVVASGPGSGHQAAAVNMIRSLRELGYDGRVDVVAPTNVRARLDRMLAADLLGGGEVHYAPDEFDPHGESPQQAPGRPGGLTLVAASDEIGADGDNAKALLSYTGADRAVVLAPYAWGMSTRAVFSRTEDGGFGVLPLEGTVDRRNALFQQHVPAPDPSSFPGNPRLQSVADRVTSGRLDLMPLYGLARLTPDRQAGAPDYLAAGIHQAGLGKPAVLLQVGNHDIPYAPPYEQPWLKRADLADPALDADGLNRLLDGLGPDDVLVLRSGPLDQDAFEKVFQLGGLPAVQEGANTTGTSQLTGRPYFSPVTSTTPYPEAVSSTAAQDLSDRAGDRLSGDAKEGLASSWQSALRPEAGTAEVTTAVRELRAAADVLADAADTATDPAQQRALREAAEGGRKNADALERSHRAVAVREQLQRVTDALAAGNDWTAAVEDAPAYDSLRKAVYQREIADGWLATLPVDDTSGTPFGLKSDQLYGFAEALGHDYDRLGDLLGEGMTPEQRAALDHSLSPQGRRAEERVIMMGEKLAEIPLGTVPEARQRLADVAAAIRELEDGYIRELQDSADLQGESATPRPDQVQVIADVLNGFAQEGSPYRQYTSELTGRANDWQQNQLLVALLHLDDQPHEILRSSPPPSVEPEPAPEHAPVPTPREEPTPEVRQPSPDPLPTAPQPPSPAVPFRLQSSDDGPSLFDDDFTLNDDSDSETETESAPRSETGPSIFDDDFVLNDDSDSDSDDRPSPPPPVSAPFQLGPVRADGGPSGFGSTNRQPAPDRTAPPRTTERSAPTPDRGEPPAKRRRTPAYENTDAVLHDRGYRPADTEQQSALRDFTDGRRFPEPTPELLGLIAPHQSPVAPAPGFRLGDDLQSCLEAVEAYRDTHYGRPRPSGQTLSGAVEPHTAQVLNRRHDLPHLFGEGQAAVDSLLDHVGRGGPGSFATVLVGREGEVGHTVALVNGADGQLRWVDPSTRQSWAAAPGSLPDPRTTGWKVWASAAGPDESTLPGLTPDRGFQAEFGAPFSLGSLFGTPQADPPAQTLPTPTPAPQPLRLADPVAATAELTADPAAFLEQHILSYDGSLGMELRSPGLSRNEAREFMAWANTQPQNWFVLVPDPRRDGALVLTPAVEKYVEAHPDHPLVSRYAERFANPPAGQPYLASSYIPYLAGAPGGRLHTVGSTTVPLDPDGTPGSEFVFTAVMNGCALAVTPGDTPDTFKAWHYQSSSTNNSSALDFRRTQQPTDWFGPEEYESGTQTALYEVTNLLWKSPADGWQVVSQETTVDPADQAGATVAAVRRRPLRLTPPTPNEEAVHLARIYTGMAESELKRFDADVENVLKQDWGNRRTQVELQLQLLRSNLLVGLVDLREQGHLDTRAYFEGSTVAATPLAGPLPAGTTFDSLAAFGESVPTERERLGAQVRDRLDAVNAATPAKDRDWRQGKLDQLLSTFVPAPGATTPWHHHLATETTDHPRA